MRYRVLGPLEVVGEDGKSIALGGDRERVLLATLLLGAGQVVTTGRLIDALWGDDPPVTASNALQVHISKLRKKLATAGASDRIRSAPKGYALDMEAEELDLAMFESQVAENDEDPSGVSDRLREALDLWHGPALADVPSELLHGEKVRLDELRFHTLERRVDAELELGRHGELVPELEALVHAEPLREALRRQLMLALYRCGRQADALGVYTSARELFAEELGIDPGPELQALELAILRQDPALAPPLLTRKSSPGSPIPAGTRTLLMPDIEGSTHFWDDHPKTRYVSVGDSDVAYQVVGNGKFDLVWVQNLGLHVDLMWDFPPSVRTLAAFAEGFRLILLDRRGTGASSRLAANAIPTWEELADDVGAVLDAVGSTRCAVVAMLETGPVAVLFAAMHPDRVSSLILLTTTARYPQAEDYPIGVPHDTAEEILELLSNTWGTQELARLTWPRADAAIHRQGSLIQRASATPRDAVSQYRYFVWNVDVRDALPLVRVPTLVLHGLDNPFVPISHGRYLAEHIAHAKFVEVPTAGLTPDEEMTGLIVEFVTGTRPPVEIDRILTTVLFSDIVRSTEHAASLGDHRWRDLLDSHDRVVRDQLRRFRGAEVKTTGDGFLASFDGPARAIRCGRSIVEATTGLGIKVRVGVHSGECEVRGDDLGGLAVHVAARVGALAMPGEVLASQMVKDLVMGGGIEFDDRGEHELKGIPGIWKLFAVKG